MSHDPPSPTLPAGEKKARMRKAFAVMAVMAVLFGAAAGAVFAWNIRPVVAAGVALGPFAAGGAVLGALVAFLAFRVVFARVARTM